ncbi:endonuclease/exonuclease/phosphatase family protein [Pseudooceanicola sp. HF7]|nr:endonuclease/exonuclease/phosphatase family protein [Pseudooceanicola sp. HF7]
MEDRQDQGTLTPRAWRVGPVPAALLAVLITAAAPAHSEPSAPSEDQTRKDLRLAYFDTELEAKGPGLLLRDILKDTAPIREVRALIEAVDPDILVLAGIDYDAEGRALAAFNAGLARPFPHLFAARPNSGLPTGLDLDGNGRLGEARDAQGYGRFSGQGALALLSRETLGPPRDFSTLLWKDLPDTLLRPTDTGAQVQRLSSVAHWLIPAGPVTLGIFRATTPVFDGPDDRNGRRNADEIRFWQLLLAGHFGTVPKAPVLIGGANLDPDKGDGRRGAIAALLGDPALQDPTPRSAEGALATVDWKDAGPGRMRVDYILPGAGLTVTGAGLADPVQASRHRLVWVDIAR